MIVLPLLLAFILPALAAEGACETLLPHRAHSQPSGPLCLPTAAAIALSTEGGALEPGQIARLVPVWPDGVDAFDLQQALARQGWEGLVFTGPPEAAARLVAVGFAPVLMLEERGRKHAVAVVGYRRERGPDGRCTGPLRSLALVDPQDGSTRWEEAGTLAGRQLGEQQIVFFPPDRRSRLDDGGFPLEAAAAVDRRFRARALLLRARRHSKPNAQSVALLEQAVAADPGWPEAAAVLAEHRKAVQAGSRSSSDR